MKKTSAIILSLCIILNLFSMNINAAEAVKQTYAEFSYPEQRGFMLMETLGVLDKIDETSYYDKFVTRGEYAHYVAMLLGTTDSYNTDTYYFEDCRDDEMINSLAALGIVNGYSEGLYMPDREVTIKEIITTIFRVSGHMAYVKALGDDNTAYFKVARNMGLSYIESLDEKATQRQAIRLLFEMCNMSMFDVVAVSNEGITYRKDGEKTVLECYRNIKFVEKQRVNANRFTSIYRAEDACAEDEILIGTTYYKTNRKEYHDYIGQTVDLYYYSQDGELGEIVCMLPCAEINETIIVDADDILSFTGDELVYYKDGTKKTTVSLAQSVYVIYNGKALSEKFEDYFDIKLGTVTLYKNSNGLYDFINIREICNVEVLYNDWSNESIYTNGEGIYEHISIGAYTDAYVWIRNNASGQTHNATHINAGDMLSVVCSLDSKLVEITICAKSVKGVLNRIENNDGTYYTIDEQRYEVTSGFKADVGVGVGDTVIAYFDETDRIVKCEISETRRGAIYGYVWAMGRRESAFSEDIKVKLYNENKELLVLEFADRVRVNGKTLDKSEAADALCKNSVFVRQLVMYDVNKDGKIYYLDTAAKAKNGVEAAGTLYEMKNLDTMPGGTVVTAKYNPDDWMFDSKYPMNPNYTRIMFLPNSDINDPTASDFGMMYKFAEKEPFGGGGLFAVGLYTSDVENPYVEFVVYQANSLSNNIYNSFAATMVVDEVYKVLGEDDSIVYRLEGYSDNLPIILNTTEDCIVKSYDASDSSAGATIVRSMDDVESGDLIQFGQTHNGDVSDVTIIYEHKTGKPTWGNGDNKGVFRIGNIKKIHHPLDSSAQKLIEIAPLVVDENTVVSQQQTKEYLSFFQSKVKFMIYDSGKRSHKISVGSINDLVDATGDKHGDVIITTNLTGGYDRMFYVWR